MALRKIIYKGDPILRKKSREITEITERIRTLAEDMWETMYEANGVGLAAPQVGVLRRLVVIDLTPPPEAESADEDTASLSEIPKKDGEQEPASAIPAEQEKAETGPTTAPEIQKYVLINPVILEVSEETVSAQEGCLSVPGMVGRVERPARIKVRARGLDGKTFELEGEGMLAKALFHEIDHLDGILYTDKAESVEDVELAEEAEAG